jgi:Na+/H+-translocating membrane pyrophosphatase
VIVSELVVVITVCGLSLVVTAFHARGSARAATTPHDLERLLAAVQRACADFLWQETRLLAAVLAIVTVAVAVPAALFGALPKGHAALGWALGVLCAGGLGGALVAHLAHGAATHTARAALEALRQDRDGAARVALRGAALLSVGIEALSCCLASLAFTAHFLFLTAARQVEPHHAALLASRTLAMLALGAACAALVFQVGGSSLHTAAGVAATGARARHPNIARDEDQNPVLVAELVGDHAGGLVARSTDALAGALLGNASVVMLGAWVSASNPSSGLSASALVALPLLVRALGQFAASVALGSTRVEGSPGPVGILLAARLSHALLLAGGVLGACLWLLGTAALLPLTGAGALGVLAGVSSAMASTAGLRRVPDAGLTGAETTVARALGLGLQRTWILMVLVGGCLGGAWWLGSRTGIVNGGVLALALAVAALLGAGAYDVSHGAFAALCENVRRFAALRRAHFDEAAKKRAHSLTRAGVTVGHIGGTQSILGAAAAALLAALLLPLASAGPAPTSAIFTLGHPVVLLGGVLGAGALSFHIGGMLRASSRAAAALDRDLSDRLARDEVSAERRSVPPGYRESVQLATAAATRALLPLALGAVLGPFALAVLLRLVYGAQSAGIGVRGLTAFSALAALTGCCAALVAEGAAVELSAGRRPSAESGPTSSAIEFMERCISPAALLGLKATVVSSLAAVPLLF